MQTVFRSRNAFASNAPAKRMEAGYTVQRQGREKDTPTPFFRRSVHCVQRRSSVLGLYRFFDYYAYLFY